MSNNTNYYKTNNMSIEIDGATFEWDEGNDNIKVTKEHSISIGAANYTSDCTFRIDKQDAIELLQFITGYLNEF